VKCTFFECECEYKRWQFAAVVSRSLTKRVVAVARKAPRIKGKGMWQRADECGDGEQLPGGSRTLDIGLESKVSPREEI
jgi:hypothetical protein